MSSPPNKPPAAPPSEGQPAEGGQGAAPRPRLESWKEIAAFLKRDVRTAKRWETEEGLPVHRHQHKKLASVYAYAEELAAWQQQRQPRAETRPPETAPERRRLLALGAAGLVVVLGVFGYLVRGGPAPAPERSWVLIGHFENRTGEEVFEDTLEYALERELSNSAAISVVPRERIHDALQLMRKPADIRLDRDTGREVCLRDGGIRALLTGRVEKLDRAYVLSAEIIEPTTGVVLAGLSEEAPEQAQTTQAVRRLAERVREVLGEHLGSIRENAVKLEKVTTPSLRALHLYSRANAVAAGFDWNQAAELLRNALAEDAEFASAHLLLGHALSNAGRPEEAAPHFERALELSDQTSGREQAFIRATYFQRVAGNNEKARAALHTLVHLYPDHYWGVSSLWFSYSSGGRPREALPYALRRAELRPAYFDHQLQAAHELLAWGEAGQAATYRDRAQQLLSAETTNTNRDAWRAARLHFFPFHKAWVKGDFDGAARELEALAKESAAGTVPLRLETGASLLALGKVARAQEMFTAAGSGPREYLALVALGLGDEEDARRHLRRAQPSHRAAVLQARTGLLDMVEEALANPVSLERPYAPYLPDAWNSLVAGELALARVDPDKAVPQLQRAVDALRIDPTAFFFLACESLARAWQQKGETGKSLAVLEQASAYKQPSIFWGPAPLFWMKNELLRARMYRSLGREADALEVEAELRKLLAQADSGHPVLRQLANPR